MKSTFNNKNIKYKSNIELDFPKKLFTLMLLLMVVLNVYLVPGTTFLGIGELLFLLSIPYFFIKANNRICLLRSNFTLIVFCVYGIIVSLISCIFMQNNFNDIMARLCREMFYYYIILVLSLNFFEKNIFEKYLERFCVILSYFIIFQVLIYQFTGVYISGLLDFLAINDGGFSAKEIYDNTILNSYNRGYLKPNGFLCEPAHCAQCLFIYLIISISKNGTANKKNIIIASIAMILTMSTGGFLELLLVAIIWFIKQKQLSKLITILVSITAIIIIYKSNFDLINFYNVIERFTSLFTNETSVSNSADLRVVKGFNSYFSMPIILEIFGIGFGSYNAAVNSGVISSTTFDLNNDYMNTISYILISSGIIGTILYSSFLRLLYKNSAEVGKYLILGMIFMFFGTAIYCQPIYLWFIILTMNLKRKEVSKCLTY